ncbi:hypothetical protein CYY_006374 [Polysphondylium violaceum]|uniref:RWP-RK domain-containing protein n=1 Tax=Polysphondylium violaceum TaxID=133409 RepID=A0A8J4Q045_9MYCE|nr:hypothetical protein CYY_006374 [Polysphondylium violaceum]
MQKVQNPVSLPIGKPSSHIHSLLLPHQETQKDNSSFREQLFSNGWNLPYSKMANDSSIKKSNSSSFNDAFHHSSPAPSPSYDYSSSSSDEDEHSRVSRNISKFFNPLPTFKQICSESQLADNSRSSSLSSILQNSSSTSLNSSPSSTSSSPSYTVPMVNLQNHDQIRTIIDQPNSPSSSYPSSPSTAEYHTSSSTKNNQIRQWLDELNQLKKREYILLENLKNFNNINNNNSSSDESEDDHYPVIHNNIRQQQEPISPNVNIQPKQTLSIQQQPSDYIICNRYIHPSPVVVVDQETINRTTGYLIVNASLVSSPNPKQPKVNNKFELLQGVKSILVEKNGVVIFNKLKLNEISSKYSNQSFNICFTLSDISSDNQIHVLSQVYSTPFHILAKTNKRKSDEIENEEPNSPLGRQSSPVCSSPSSPSSPPQTVKSFDESTTIQSSQQQQSGKNSDNVPTSNGNDPNYIDITDLLILPQKEAAARLGISESMLCKRFKECTRRKWPYRYLRKIDKVIKILSFQNINEIPKEEKEKLERFIIEREECLRPVKIRITGCLEKDNDSPAVAPTVTTVDSQQQQSFKSSKIQNLINSGSVDETTPTQKEHANLFQAFIHGGESNGLENIVETLEMLKHTRQ